MKRLALTARKRKSLYCPLTIAFLMLPAVCSPSYLIRLTNGNQLIIYEYWEDGGQIRFYSCGGVVGVRKGLVREIEEASLSYIIEEPKPPERWDDQVGIRDKLSSEQEEALLPDSGDKALLEEKKLVMMRFSAVSAAFREAKAKHDRKQMQEERKRLLSSQTELSRLLKKVRDVHGGQLPTWWDEPLPAD